MILSDYFGVRYYIKPHLSRRQAFIQTFTSYYDSLTDVIHLTLRKTSTLIGVGGLRLLR